MFLTFYCQCQLLIKIVSTLTEFKHKTQYNNCFFSISYNVLYSGLDIKQFCIILVTKIWKQQYIFAFYKIFWVKLDDDIVDYYFW